MAYTFLVELKSAIRLMDVIIRSEAEKGNTFTCTSVPSETFVHRRCEIENPIVPGALSR